MLYVIEAAIALYLALEVRNIYRASALRNAGRFIIFLAALAVAAGVFRIVEAATSGFLQNFVVRMGVSVLMSMVGFSVAQTLLTRLVFGKRKKKLTPGNGQSGVARHLTRPFDRVVVLGFVLLYLAAMFVFLHLMVNLAANTNARHAIANDTLFLKYLLIDRRAGGASGETLSRQERFLRTVGEAISNLGDYLSEKTGTKKVLTNVHALQDIVSAPQEERTRLADDTPALQNLIENPRIQAVAQNEEVMGLIDRIANGSTKAVVELAKLPVINDLMNDEQVRKTMTEVDLVDLQKKLLERRAETAKGAEAFEDDDPLGR